MVRQKAEEARVSIRNIRRDEVQRVDRMQKEGGVPEDEAKRAVERLQKITDQHVGRVEHVAGAKEAEVMEV
jgi:ribosome recycling factor